ncbi:Uncharacterised protein [Corynebacterium imitans]|uniref:Uncharacterized protein n=1 Tax=Corynebacterium imitans TaxID=156978 RepID=A0A076NLH1_9CORY|nr:hypothetical protein [Corynebacterium imitans]AIJ33021.1 hypothetical protein CIMIT_03060 [Corynebacterium imitans]SNV61250.1 Uncharacterised protein [Corynebacterium imitans]
MWVTQSMDTYPQGNHCRGYVVGFFTPNGTWRDAPLPPESLRLNPENVAEDASDPDFCYLYAKDDAVRYVNYLNGGTAL